jgi:SAM-dependent methyltransferase
MADKAHVLKSEYNMRFSVNSGYRDALWRLLCRDYFQTFLPPPPEMTVLDLGCGWGEFINHIQAAHKYAMDLNPESRRRLAPDVRFLQQDCSRTWEVPAESLDVVFTSNFLEHLPDKASVTQTVKEAFRCLNPGGQMVCMGPNIKYLPGAYWDFWDHFIPLTELSIAELLRLEGFDIRHQTPRFIPYSMSTGINPPLFLVRLYLKSPVPLAVLRQAISRGRSKVPERRSHGPPASPCP